VRFTVFQRFREHVNHQSDQTLRVSMLGPSGVGKTSLLATMYERLEHVVAGADLQLSPAPEDAKILEKQVSDLERLFHTDEQLIDTGRGIAGTAGWRDFAFGLGRRGKRSSLSLQFVDYPGGWIEESSGENLAWVLDLLRDSDAILVPIDAPALMEHDGLWHRERNRPGFIYNLIKDAYTDLRSPRLVILSPIRCERYVRDAASAQQLAERTLEGYRLLLEHLAFGDLGALVAVVIAPVETLGEIELSALPPNEYHPQFAKTHPGASFNPRDSEQPLRYVLRFAMRLHHDQRQSGYFSAIRRMFRSDRHLIEAAERFAGGCRDDIPFAVVQGHDWLDLMVTQ
jgi:hypothetical protein